jgi:hypothetical protein
LPLVWTWNNDKELVQRYDNKIPLAITLNDDQVDKLLARRKELIYELEKWQADKKVAEKARDFEQAKFCREMVNSIFAWVTAMEFILPWFVANPPKSRDGKIHQPSMWPVELVREFDFLLWEIENL